MDEQRQQILVTFHSLKRYTKPFHRMSVIPEKGESRLILNVLEQSDSQYYNERGTQDSTWQGNGVDHNTDSSLDINIKCADCDFMTTTKARLEKHTTTKHNNEEKEKQLKKCPVCNYSSPRANCVQLHFARVHEEKTYKCEWSACSFEFKTLSKLNEHIQSEHESIKYTCSECGFETTHTNILQRHKKSYHMNTNDNCSPDQIDEGEPEIMLPEDYIKEETDDFDYTGEHQEFLKTLLEENKGGKEYRSLMESINGENLQLTEPKRKKSYQCSFCDFRATQCHSLKEHILSKHSTEEEKKKHLKKCPDCNYSSVRLSCLKRHYEIMHERKSHVCEWAGCDFVTQRKPLLKDHIRSIHQGMEFICDKCGFETSSQGYLSKHKKTVHGNENDSLLCEQCSYIAKSGAELKKHRDEHNVCAFECKQCDYKTKNDKLLKRHISMKHSNKDPYLCAECDFTTALKPSLNRHIANVHQGLRFPCPDCEYEAKSRPYLFEHVRRIHNKVIDASYFIAHPHLMPKNTNGLVKQLKPQDLENAAQYTCEICQKVFKNEAILLEHSISHSGERPYCCRMCNKSYPLVKGLKVHMRLIHGPAYQEREKPDQCNVCGIKITKLFRLIEHEISHTGELPYQCLICKEKFAMTQTLAIHMKKHSTARTLNNAVLTREEEDGHTVENIQSWGNVITGSLPLGRPDINIVGLELTSQRFDPGPGIGGHWGTGIGIGPTVGQPRY